jgi:hypothetical protein
MDEWKERHVEEREEGIKNEMSMGDWEQWRMPAGM